MTIMITLGLHTGCIGGIFITGIFTLSGGEFLTFKTGIPGGLARHDTDDSLAKWYGAKSGV